jgi:rRNA biogenesis protein RRP5
MMLMHVSINSTLSTTSPQTSTSKPYSITLNPQVQGYVRHVSTKGLFVCLDRDRDARVKLSNMSDGFLEDPAAAFPEGTLVKGRLIAAGVPKGGVKEDGGKEGAGAARLEMSLRSGGGGEGAWRQLEDVKEGEVTTGKVRGGGVA